MNDEPTTAPDPVAKKPPRKPRPSEIAAKKAKAAKKKKPATKKTKSKAKPKAKKKPVKKAAKSKTKAKRAKSAKKAKKKVHGPGVIRTERLDLRLTKQEKAKIMARSRKTKRTATSVIMEAIHKVKW